MIPLQGLKAAVNVTPFDRELRLVYSDALEESEQQLESLRQRNIALLLLGLPISLPRKQQSLVWKIQEITHAKSKKVQLVCAEKPPPLYPPIIGRAGNLTIDRDNYRWILQVPELIQWLFPPKDDRAVITVDLPTRNGRDKGLTICGWPDALAMLVPPDCALTDEMIRKGR